jgi:hypothetical protein
MPRRWTGHRVGGNARVLVTAADDLVRAQFKVATSEYIGQGNERAKYQYKGKV